MFIPTVLSIKQLCRDLLVAYPAEATPAEEWERGSLYFPFLSRIDYGRAVRTLPHLTEMIRQWHCRLPPEVEHFLGRCLQKFCEQPCQDLSAYPDYKFDNEFYHSPEKRRQLWREQKEWFLEEIILVQEYLDLALCAAAANQVALALGRRGGVRAQFAGYYPLPTEPDQWSRKWQETPGGKIYRMRDSEVDSLPETLFTFAKIVIETD
jgi:hypothetical protein